MQAFEKLGLFYLGRRYDPATRQRQQDLLLYDSTDLVTHAVVVGMTGSGKTGLCVTLIEEAAIDGIPAIVIDPKGDLSNLLLTFPELRAEDFAPWINEDDARRKAMSAGDFAAKEAERWKAGLADWGQDGNRIRRLRAGADFALYTPGSAAGISVSILRSFAAPAGPVDDQEALRDRVANTATSILGLVGIAADPIRSREHILLSTILDRAWRAGEGLDLASLVHLVQAPPVERVGVLDLESFFPAKDRFELAMAFNSLLAAPGFGAWLEGEALDIGAMLHTSAGKPRVAIFSLAHLGDAERMFFVSLLLNETIGWMRTQAGTTSLRALLYMDEIVGYFPPVANPASKGPLLTLLKQARAYGLGVVLATQNPVDLDYKGLSNAGTWFIGRLQTERDIARLLDGLEGAAASGSGGFDRGRTEQTIAGLAPRVFLMNNVHNSAPEIFETRWALSYLRGPLGRTQIKTLTDRRPASRSQADAIPEHGRSLPATAVSPVTGGTAGARPALPPDIPQYFVPRRRAGGPLVYIPKIAASARIEFCDTKAKINVVRDVLYLAPLSDNPALPVDWQMAQEADVALADLEKSSQEDARYLPVAAGALKATNYTPWGRELVRWLCTNQTIELLKSEALGVLSQPGEGEGEFRVRLQQIAREQLDAQKERLRAKYAPKISALEERGRRAKQALERETEQASSRKVQTAVSLGATLLSTFLGRKAMSAGTLGRATTTARDVGRSMKEAQDVGRARETVQAIEQQRASLEEQLDQDTAMMASRTDPQTAPLQTIAVRPKRSDISVRFVALAWTPHVEDTAGNRTAAY